jgi:hypothetical protein
LRLVLLRIELLGALEGGEAGVQTDICAAIKVKEALSYRK